MIEDWQIADLDAHYKEHYRMMKEKQPCCIGICGPRGSGKSTLARQLEQYYNYTREPFAQFLKSMLRTFLHDQGCPENIINRMLDGDLKEIETIYFHHTTARRAMQTLGTEWCETIHHELWSSAWERKMEALTDKKIVVEDLRFLHEVAAIRRQPGNYIVRVERPGTASDLQHKSESEYLQIQPDWVLVNSGTPEDLLRELSDRVGL